MGEPCTRGDICKLAERLCARKGRGDFIAPSFRNVWSSAGATAEPNERMDRERLCAWPWRPSEAGPGEGH